MWPVCFGFAATVRSFGVTSATESVDPATEIATSGAEGAVTSAVEGVLCLAAQVGPHMQPGAAKGAPLLRYSCTKGRDCAQGSAAKQQHGSC